jgi:hypothetical protein
LAQQGRIHHVTRLWIDLRETTEDEDAFRLAGRSRACIARSARADGEWRSRARLLTTLIEERTRGCSASARRCFTTASRARPSGCEFLGQLELPAYAGERVTIALAMIDSIDAQLHPLEASCANSRVARPAAVR